MQSVEITVIREICRELFIGADFEKSLKKGNFARPAFVKKVSAKLIEKLREEHTDRTYTGRTINLLLNRQLTNALKFNANVTAISVEYTMKSNKRPRNDPIIDYDSDVSSNDETLDQSTLDSSLMDSMNDSQVSTRSTSCRMEQLEAKINVLEARAKAAEARAKAAEDKCRVWQEKSRDLFKVGYRPTRANGSGKCEVFDTRLDAIVLDAENRGVAAKHIHDVCQSFVDVLGWFDEDDPEYRIVFIEYLSGFSTRETT